MRQRTVVEVRESLTQAIGHILQVISRERPPQPPPSTAANLEFLAGTDSKGKHLGCIFQQLQNYMSNNSSAFIDLEKANIGKVGSIKCVFQLDFVGLIAVWIRGKRPANKLVRWTNNSH